MNGYKMLNEGFKNKFESNILKEELEQSQTDELLTMLKDKVAELQDDGETDIKKFEFALKDVLEGQFPELDWFEITDCDIFNELFEGTEPEEVAQHIVDNLKPELDADDMSIDDEFADDDLEFDDEDVEDDVDFELEDNDEDGLGESLMADKLTEFGRKLGIQAYFDESLMNESNRYEKWKKDKVVLMGRDKDTFNLPAAKNLKRYERQASRGRGPFVPEEDQIPSAMMGHSGMHNTGVKIDTSRALDRALDLKRQNEREKAIYRRQRRAPIQIDADESLNEERDFEFGDTLYCVVKDDGTYAGIPCTSEEEARELSNQHEGSVIYELKLNDDNLYECGDVELEEGINDDRVSPAFTDGSFDKYIKHTNADDIFGMTIGWEKYIKSQDEA